MKKGNFSTTLRVLELKTEQTVKQEQYIDKKREEAGKQVTE